MRFRLESSSLGGLIRRVRPLFIFGLLFLIVSSGLQAKFALFQKSAPPSQTAGRLFIERHSDEIRMAIQTLEEMHSSVYRMAATAFLAGCFLGHILNSTARTETFALTIPVRFELYGAYALNLPPPTH
jgi:hypothetical protein